MPKQNSFAGVYDIPIEDLRRYRKLKPREILRWLTQINALARSVSGGTITIKRPSSAR